jgi:hypothetical protein
VGESERGRAGDATPGNEHDGEHQNTPADPPPPGVLDLGNGEVMCVGTEADFAAAADWLRRNYPRGVQGERYGPETGPVLNMGHDLYRMLRASEIFPTATRGEQAVALIIADICMDTTRRPPANMNASARVCEDLGMPSGTLGNMLARLAARGLELRVPIGKDKNGRLVFAAKGHAVDFLFPALPPRESKGPRIDGALSAKGPRIDGPLDSEGPRISGPLSAKGPLDEAQRSTPAWTPTPVTPKSKEDARSLSQREPAMSDAAGDERENDFDEDEDDEDEPNPYVELLAKAVPGADPRDIEWALTGLDYRKFHGEINSIPAYLRTLVKNGDAPELIADAAAERRRAKAQPDPFDWPAANGRQADPWAPAPPFGGPVVAGEVISEDAAAAVRMADKVRSFGLDVTDAEASAAAVILIQEGAHSIPAALELARKQIETETTREATVRAARAKLISDTRAKLDEIRVSARW